MKKIWLMGGLGNVLFQILAFRIIEAKTNSSAKYITYLTEKNIITKAIKWSIHDQLYKNFIPEDKIKKVSFWGAICPIILGMFSKLTGKYFSFASFYIKQLSIDTHSISENVFGYFQDKPFLKNHTVELLELGREIREKYEIIDNEKTIVHYRKGDSGWAVTNDDYYIEVKKMLCESGEEVIVVTDSPTDAAQFFEDIPNVEISNSKSAMEDFIIMLSAKKLFCAPSTFSWWAAHTLPHSCEVIAPQFLDDLLGFYTNCQVKLI